MEESQPLTPFPGVSKAVACLLQRGPLFNVRRTTRRLTARGLSVLACLVAAPVLAKPAAAPAPHQVTVVSVMHDIVDHWPGLKTLDPAASSQNFILVDVSRQRLYLFKHGALADAWPVSTSRYGTGERAGSRHTPLGLFQIVNKVGAGLPKFTVLNRHGSAGWATRPVYATDDPAASTFIISRILMLQGLEPGWNEGGTVDTYARHVYIHGTPDLGQLGKPASEGCVQMAPSAVIALFRAVDRGTLVLIVPDLRTLPAVPGESGRV